MQSMAALIRAISWVESCPVKAPGRFRDWDALEWHPGASIWLRLFWEARAEINDQFRVFRYVELLEALARDHLDGHDIQELFDPTGSPLLMGWRGTTRATTTSTRGVI